MKQVSRGMKRAKKGVSLDISAGPLYIKKVPKKGRGVFASKFFVSGSTVEIAPLILIPTEEYDLIACSVLSSYLFTVGDTDTSALALGYASLYNHSKNANCEYFVNGNVVLVKAVVDIFPDQELTINYGWDEEAMKENGIIEDAAV